MSIKEKSFSNKLLSEHLKKYQYIDLMDPYITVRDFKNDIFSSLEINPALISRTMKAKGMSCKFYLASNTSFLYDTGLKDYEIHKLDSLFVNKRPYYLFLVCVPLPITTAKNKEEPSLTEKDIEILQKANALFILGGNPNFKVSSEGLKYLHQVYPIAEYVAEYSKKELGKGRKAYIILSYELLPFIYNFVLKTTQKKIVSPPVQLGPSKQFFSVGKKLAPFVVIIE